MYGLDFRTLTSATDLKMTLNMANTYFTDQKGDLGYSIWSNPDLDWCQLSLIGPETETLPSAVG